jgi:DNA polymerase-1
LLALIDGDIVCYRCAAVNENAAEGIAKWQADQLLTRIIEDVNASDWKVFLSGDNNFRYKLYPDYKANRRDMVKPKHLEVLREHLVLEWNAVICDGYEADDALGIAQKSAGPFESVVCTIDKDLRQLAGCHYHFVNRQWVEVSDLDATKNFYTQLLTGDATDNIRGCPGIGPVKAARALADCKTEVECYQAVEKLYREALKDKWESELNLQAQLLYILRTEGDQWQKPNTPETQQPEKETPSKSSGKTPSSSTVPTTMETDTYIQPVGTNLDTTGPNQSVENTQPL